MTKAEKLLQRLVQAVGDCEDTEAVLAIAKDASLLLNEREAINYYRQEIETMRLCNLRAVTAAEYLLENFDKIYPKPKGKKE